MFFETWRQMFDYNFDFEVLLAVQFFPIQKSSIQVFVSFFVFSTSQFRSFNNHHCAIQWNTRFKRSANQLIGLKAS